MVQATHIGIVFNPSKGARDELEQAVAAATADAGGPAVTWHETEVDDPGISATRAALEAGADLVLAAGGDGTVRAVAAHLAEAGATAELGIIPLGTGNLLARNLGVPLGRVSNAVERALTGEARAIDVGWAELEGPEVSGRYAFAVMAGFGIDAHMITETDDDLKDKAGWVAYVESLGRAVTVSEVLDVTLDFGDGETEDDRAHTLIVGNCGTLQGGFTLLPDADPSDGVLDLFVLDAEGVGGWMDTLKNVVWDNGLARAFGGGQKAASSESVTHRQLARLELTLAEPRVFEVDGDDLGEVTRAAISIQPGAIRVR